MEIWRRVKGHNGYEVSNWGRVRKSEHFEWYKQANGKKGEVYFPERFIPIHRNEQGTDFVFLGEKHVRKSVADIQAEAFRGIDL